MQPPTSLGMSGRIFERANNGSPGLGATDRPFQILIILLRTSSLSGAALG